MTWKPPHTFYRNRAQGLISRDSDSTVLHLLPTHSTRVPSDLIRRNNNMTLERSAQPVNLRFTYMS
jgi:hypothetical protein